MNVISLSLAARHYCLLGKPPKFGGCFLPQQQRQKSAWCNASDAQFEGADLEKLFINKQVQGLLKAITGFNLAKVHKWRMTHGSNRRHYALMTEGMHNEFLHNLSQRAQPFLQCVPWKEPRPNRADTLAMNPELAGHDTYNLVFIDVSADSTNRERTVAIREPSGRLRTALPEEHYRMDRIFFEKPDRPVREPAVFGFYLEKDGKPVPGHILKETLDRGEHEFILDWACQFYEPDDPKFVYFSKCIFEHAIETRQLEQLHSTRHFHTLAFYMLINGRVNELLNFFAEKENLSGAANTIRLFRMIFSSWKTTVSSHDSDMKVVKDFLDAPKGAEIEDEAEELDHSQEDDKRNHWADRKDASRKVGEQFDELQPLRTFYESLQKSHQQRQNTN